MIYKIIVVILIAIFYIAYFIKLICQRFQGIRTVQLGKGKIGLQKYIEITLKSITLINPIIQFLSIIFHNDIVSNVLILVGIVILLFADIIFVLAIFQMKNNWRAGIPINDKISLVSNGIYSVSRNPAFLAFDLMYI